jgi:hypothetical protein
LLCVRICMWLTCIDGFWIGWLDLSHLIHSHSSELQAIQHCRYSTHFQFTVTLALEFSVFTSRILATDFIIVSLSIQITHGVFLSQPNSFLAIILQLPVQFFCSQANILVGWRLEARLTLLTEIFITALHGPRRKHSLCIFGNACLQRRCIATEVTWMLLAYSLPR